MYRFGRIVVQTQNLNPEVALHSMLLALWLDKFADSLCKKKTLVAWRSYMNKPKATSKWRCQGLETRSDKPDKSVTKEKEAFNTEVPIKLPPPIPPRSRLDKTKYCRYHRSYGHNTKDCWTLKDKLEELILVRDLA